MGRASRCVARCGRFKRLAIRTPESRSRIEPLFARFDRGATTTAGLTASAINPEIFFAIGASGGPPQSGVSDNFVGRRIRHIGEQEFARGGYERGHLENAERCDGSERMYRTGKTDFRFENIADPRQQ